MGNDSFGLEELRTAVENAGWTAPAVSKWSVGMHIHHCCLAMSGVFKALAASNTPAPDRRSSLTAAIVFRSGKIPRGQAKSPQATIPKPDITRPELLEIVEECRRAFAETEQLDPGAWFEHFYFGVLDKEKALAFVRMHNKHHLSIISDVKKA